MYSEFLTAFHAWSGLLQFFFVIIITTLATMIVVKFLDVIDNFIGAIPIIVHGYPKKGDDVEIVNESDDDDDEPEPPGGPKSA